MKIVTVTALMAILLLTGVATTDASAVSGLLWTDLPSLPNATGVAGAFIGTHNEVLMIAGGANFPGDKPWDGGKKVWHDRVYILAKNDSGGYEWITGDFRLPGPLAYGASISTCDGVICIGGNDSKQSYADVFRLQWNPALKKVKHKRLPSLPFALSNMGAAKVDDVIYVMGGKNAEGDTRSFLSLDLNRIDSGWRVLPQFPGEARAMPVVVAHTVMGKDRVFVFSGRISGALHTLKFFTDSWSYDPQKNSWRRLRDVMGQKYDGTSGLPVVAAPAISNGTDEILVFGGGGSDRCSVKKRIANAVRIEKINSGLISGKIRESDMTAQVEELLAANRNLMKNDAGHRHEVLAYRPSTDSWRFAGKIPEGRSALATTAVLFYDGIVIPSGETNPGVRTAKLSMVRQNDAIKNGEK